MTSDYKTRLVSGVLEKNDKVLLGYRVNTQVFSNRWSLPVGHVEANESSLVAIERELREELGIEVLLASALFEITDSKMSISHRVFLIEKWEGEIENKELALCRELKWFSPTDLPKPTTPTTRTILEKILNFGEAR